MKTVVLKALVLATGVAVIMSVTGCEEQQVPGTKRARIIAVENRQLKKQLQQRDSDMEKLKEQYDNESKNQKELLAKCEQEKKSLQEQLTGKFEAKLNDFIKSLGEENKKLLGENESLKAQIEELKEKVKELDEKMPVELNPLEQP